MFTRNLLILAATFSVGAVCSAADLPMRKPGLWEITMNMGNPKSARELRRCAWTPRPTSCSTRWVPVPAKRCAARSISRTAVVRWWSIQCDLGGTRSVPTVSRPWWVIPPITQTSAYTTTATVSQERCNAHARRKVDRRVPGGHEAGRRDGGRRGRMPVPMKMNLNDMLSRPMKILRAAAEAIADQSVRIPA